VSGCPILRVSHPPAGVLVTGPAYADATGAAGDVFFNNNGLAQKGPPAARRVGAPRGYPPLSAHPQGNSHGSWQSDRFWIGPPAPPGEVRQRTPGKRGFAPTGEMQKLTWRWLSFHGVAFPGRSLQVLSRIACLIGEKSARHRLDHVGSVFFPLGATGLLPGAPTKTSLLVLKLANQRPVCPPKGAPSRRPSSNGVRPSSSRPSSKHRLSSMSNPPQPGDSPDFEFKHCTHFVQKFQRRRSATARGYFCGTFSPPCLKPDNYEPPRSATHEPTSSPLL